MSPTPSYSPVTEHHSLCSRGSNRQLEGCVEIVLLLVRAVNHLSPPDHQETRVAKVTRVQPVAVAVQNHYAGSAAPCKIRRQRTGR